MKKYDELMGFLQEKLHDISNKKSAENDFTFIEKLNENLNSKVDDLNSWSEFKSKIDSGEVTLNLHYNSDNLKNFANKTWKGNNMLLIIRAIVLATLFTIFVYQKHYLFLSLFAITFVSSVLMSIYTTKRTLIALLTLPLLAGIFYLTPIHWSYLAGIFISCYFACLVHNRYDAGIKQVATRNQYFFFELFSKAVVASFQFKNDQEYYTYISTDNSKVALQTEYAISQRKRDELIRERSVDFKLA